MTVGAAPYVQPTAPRTRCSQYIRFASICLDFYLPTVPVPLHSTISRPCCPKLMQNGNSVPFGEGDFAEKKKFPRFLLQRMNILTKFAAD